MIYTHTKHNFHYSELMVPAYTKIPRRLCRGCNGRVAQSGHVPLKINMAASSALDCDKVVMSYFVTAIN